MKYIDLFSGIGGFRIALDSLGNKCVFSSEINEKAAKVYKANFNDDSLSDITKIDESNIPKHNLLTAGFPCQSFSKAGRRKGFDDTRGTLFFDIVRIIKFHSPKYLLLENVSSLVNHNNGDTFKTIISILKKEGYITTKHPLIISPMSFGVPQIRKRIIIPAIKKNMMKDEIEYIDIKIPEIKKTHINLILDKNPYKKSDLYLTKYQNKVFDAWNEFIEYFDDKHKIMFPIWTYEWEIKGKIDDSIPFWEKKIHRKE